MIADKQTMIIFTTARPNYALKGYKVNAVEYLLKPIFFEDFESAVFYLTIGDQMNAYFQKL